MRSLAFGVQLIARGDGDPATTPFPSHRVMSDDAVRVGQMGFRFEPDAAGGPQMFELTARYGRGWNMAGGGTRPETVREKYDEFASAAELLAREVVPKVRSA